VQIDDLRLSMIDSQMRLSASREIISAAVWSAQRGYGAHTCHRFVAALVMTDTLRDPGQWPVVLRKIKNLQIDADLLTLESGRLVVGDIE
jgi:hypothetical protein